MNMMFAISKARAFVLSRNDAVAQPTERARAFLNSA
jgi:CHASE3 domain sensor protein